MSDTYNDRGLSMKLFGDFLVAFSVTFCVSPFTQIIDRGIVEQAAGKNTITASLMQSIATIAKSPIIYVKSPAFLLMWSVFACTYTTANCCKTLMENQQAQATRRKEAAIDELRRRRKREMTTAMLALKPTHYSPTNSQPLFTLNEWSVLCGTTMVNSGLSLLRDKCYAQMFGTASRASRVPIITYGFWAIRDCTMVGSSFILPDVVGGMLHERCGINPTDSVRIAQFSCPVISQFIAGPAHFVGLDFYNRPMRDKPLRLMLFERGSLLANNFVSLLCARVARIAPVYSIGGVGNSHFRMVWKEYLISKEVQSAIHQDNAKEKTESVKKLVDLIQSKEEAKVQNRDDWFH